MDNQRLYGLNALYKNLRRLYMVYLAAAVAALALFFVSKPCTLAVLGVSIIYHLLLVRPRSVAYQHAYTDACTLHMLEQHLKNAAIAPPLDPQELQKVRLVAANPQKSSILCREGGSGEYHGRKVRLGDVTNAHSFLMDGQKHHEFVSGLWVTVELDHDSGMDWRIIHRKMMMKPSRDSFFQTSPDLVETECSDPGLPEESFLILRSANAPRQPGDEFLQGVEELYKNTPATFGVCVLGSQLHLFVTNRLLGQNVNIREAPSLQDISCDRLPELPYLLRLSDYI